MDREERKNANRLDTLENILEKHTRTERHLEQHSDIANKDQIKHSKEIQGDRENEIRTIENKIIFGDTPANTNELDSINKSFEYTKNYLVENAKEMDDFTLEKTIEKQQNRKEQMNNFKKGQEGDDQNKNEQD
ncbi:MAG TPA: hypothetical protein DEP72_08345 [Clostridiales bacterium]|nr:MAG: hypothetical protein A2Y18_03315 [Clostridiales bacterium GWD2_32_19]HCC08147.1 hypothetical protein [Clostridiales bacterium]